MLETSFTDHSHTGCVRTVAVSQQGILATGSSDESIRLFSLTKRKELGSLIHHDGYISCLTFYGKNHLFSCSADKTVAVWNTSNWECEKTLRGHKDVVSSITIHPSGKLALSVSRNKMCTWNLLTGKCAYKTALKLGADFIKWTPDGKHYALSYYNTVEIYAIETATVEQTLKLDFRINCVEFLKEDILIIGGEGGNIVFYDTGKNKTVFTLKTTTVRIKALAVCKCGYDDTCMWLTTGSSDGWIKIWKISQDKGKWCSSLEAETDTKFRIVSMAIHPQQQQVKSKQPSLVKVKASVKSKKLKSKTTHEDSVDSPDKEIVDLDSETISEDEEMNDSDVAGVNDNSDIEENNDSVIDSSIKKKSTKVKNLQKIKQKNKNEKTKALKRKGITDDTLKAVSALKKKKKSNKAKSKKMSQISRKKQRAL